MAGKVSLRELMGKKGADEGLSLSNLPDILGDSMPELPKDNVGRFRLIRALQQRFGKGFRSMPGVSGLIKEFDDDIQFEGIVGKMKKVGKR
jgi:hypothetical protein